MNTASYIFQEDWFSHNIPNLSILFDTLKPRRILEVGSYDGRSACWFIEKSLEYHIDMEIYCVDSWVLGEAHTGVNDISAAESRFDRNIQLAADRFPHAAITKFKESSHTAMMFLCVENYLSYFDFIYIDGSHKASDVLLDALLAHKLVRVGGVIAFDDYWWSPLPLGQQDHYLLVKPAVDHYVNTFQRQVSVVQGLSSFQLYVQKMED